VFLIERVCGRRGAARFHGYSLDAAGRPTFAWSVGGLRISETIDPVVEDAQATVVRRTIRLTGRPTAGEAWFREVLAKQVEEAPDGWLRIDGSWRLRVRGAGVGPATRRTIDGKTEIRHAIVWTAAGDAEVVEEYSW
jgi:hypothetical protein